MLVTYFVNFRQLTDYLFGKELFIRFTASAFRKLRSIYVFSYFPFGFEGRMWDLIVSVPDHCLSFHLVVAVKCVISSFLYIGSDYWLEIPIITDQLLFQSLHVFNHFISESETWIIFPDRRNALSVLIVYNACVARPCLRLCKNLSSLSRYCIFIYAHCKYFHFRIHPFSEIPSSK